MLSCTLSVLSSQDDLANSTMKRSRRTDPMDDHISEFQVPTVLIPRAKHSHPKQVNAPPYPSYRMPPPHDHDRWWETTQTETMTHIQIHGFVLSFISYCVWWEVVWSSRETGCSSSVAMLDCLMLENVLSTWLQLINLLYLLEKENFG